MKHKRLPVIGRQGSYFITRETLNVWKLNCNRLVEHNRTIGFDSVDRWEKIRRLQKSKRTRKIWSFVVNKGDEGEEFLERNMGHGRCLLCGFDDLRRCGDITFWRGSECSTEDPSANDKDEGQPIDKIFKSNLITEHVQEISEWQPAGPITCELFSQ